MRVRNLNAGDVRFVVRLIGSEVEVVGAAVASAKGDKDDRAMQVGQEVLKGLLDRHFDAMWGWLADLAGMTPEEFDQQPMSAPLDVIEALMASGEVPAFFERVRSLAGRFAPGETPPLSGTA